MEENKVLTEEEKEQVNGGTDAAFPGGKMSVFCPICKSLDVKEKTFTVDKNNKLIKYRTHTPSRALAFGWSKCDVWLSIRKPFFPAISGIFLS